MTAFDRPSLEKKRVLIMNVAKRVLTLFTLDVPSCQAVFHIFEQQSVMFVERVHVIEQQG